MPMGWLNTRSGMKHREQKVAQNPFILLFRALKLRLSGKMRLTNNTKNIKFTEQGEDFFAFRKLVVDPDNKKPDSSTVIFKIIFRFKNFSERTNRILSLIPVPLIGAQPGFRSKTWFINDKTGKFMGYYEFDSIEYVKAYCNSLPLKMMRKRALPGSLKHSLSYDNWKHNSERKFLCQK